MKRIFLNSLVLLLLCLLTGIVLTACGGGGGSDSGGGTGTLSTSLTDSASDDYQAVYVTIARVDVHLGGNENDAGTWQTVASPNKTYNLLELVNGVRETLGVATMETGTYTQMRLIISESLPQTVPPDLNIFSQPHPYANYVIDKDDNEIHQLKVPSGTNTGLKVVNGFDISTDQTTELILDFDASSSVVKAGNSGQYLLKPTVKVLTTENYALVEGVVTDNVTPTSAALPGSYVTAQTADTVESGTIADENGDYTLFLEPGGYNLVATKTGYRPVCTPETLVANVKKTVNFSLPTAASGNISGTIIITGAAENQHATIDFRRETICTGNVTPSMITVKTINVLADTPAGAAYSAVDLPEGDYRVVASSYNKATWTSDKISVASGVPKTQDITLTAP
jgi:hypothetical protein